MDLLAHRRVGNARSIHAPRGSKDSWPSKAWCGPRSEGRPLPLGALPRRSASGRGRSAAQSNFRLRPNFTPRRFASFTPARVRSAIRLRSSSARTPIICHMARPVGVSVSMASVSDRNFTPRCFRSSSIAIKSRKLRPNRSSFRTVSVSPWSGFFKQRSKAGRLVVATVRRRGHCFLSTAERRRRSAPVSLRVGISRRQDFR